MKIVYYFIILIAIRFVYSFAKKESNKINDVFFKDSDDDFFVMRQPKIYSWVGIICALVFSILLIYMIVFPNNTDGVGARVGCIAFIILGLIIFVTSIKWKILIYKNYMVQKTVFGRCYKYDYCEIKSAKLTDNFLIIKANKNDIAIDSKVIGIKVLLNRLRENNITIELKNK